LQLGEFLGSPFGSVLEHHVDAGAGAEVLGDPGEDGVGAAVQMVGEDEDADDEFAVFVGVQVVSGADVPVVGGVGDACGAVVVAVFEVEQIDVDEAGKELGGFGAVVAVGVPDDGHVDVDVFEGFEPLLQPRGGLAADEVGVAAAPFA